MATVGKTQLIAILDQSGSMANMAKDVIGGFNTFLQDQRKLEGKATLTLVTFDTGVKTIYENLDIQEAPELTLNTYRPGGGTALLDAIGKTVRKASEDFNKMPEEERPDNTLVMIMTDGEENSSREYKLDNIRFIVEALRASDKWEFSFVGANMDAFSEGAAMGMSTRGIASHAVMTSGAVGQTFSKYNTDAARYRSTGKL